MESSQHIYDGIASTLTKTAINLDSTNRKKLERIKKITQEISENKYPRPIVSATAFQPSKSMDPDVVHNLRIQEATIIAECESKIQKLRLDSLQSDHDLAKAELATFNHPHEVRNKILQLLPILGNQPATITNIVNDISVRIGNYLSEKARKAAVAQVAPPNAMAVDPPPEQHTIDSLAAQMLLLTKSIEKLQANDSGSRHRRRGSADTIDGTMDNKRNNDGKRSASASTQPRRNRADADNHDSARARNQPHASNRGQQRNNGSSKSSSK